MINAFKFDLLDANKPIFLISMKRPAAMNKVNDLLARIDKASPLKFHPEEWRSPPLSDPIECPCHLSPGQARTLPIQNQARDTLQVSSEWTAPPRHLSDYRI